MHLHEPPTNVCNTLSLPRLEELLIQLMYAYYEPPAEPNDCTQWAFGLAKKGQD
jgi:hypothetical protein